MILRNWKEKKYKIGIDICTGGVPCQPFSVAGKQNGTNDDRYLWPDMFRIIEQLEPTFVIIENVKGLINIQEGMVFETVCSDLESEGFEVQAFVIPAASALPTKRKSLIVGYSEYNGSLTTEIERRNFEVNAWTQEREDKTSESERAGRSSNNEIMENSRRTLRQRSRSEKRMKMKLEKKMPICLNDQVAHPNLMWPTPRANQVTPNITEKNREKLANRNKSNLEEVIAGHCGTNWSVEPNVGKVAHGIPGRAHRLKALGNSIVPKIAEEIGRAIVTAKNN